MMQGARDLETRKTDSLAMLQTENIDVWVATASAAGAPYLVPVSLAWVDDCAVIAIAESSVTAQNLRETGEARLGVGPTRDVVMIHSAVEKSVDVAGDDALWTAYTAQADWDPRREPGYVFFVLRPVRLQAWREVNEMARRTLMRDGTWLV